MATYDALLLVSFGGPERAEDVEPFLENVTRGRGVPPERLADVAAHYHHFGGRSPLNDQNRALLAAWTPALRRAGIDLPVYWGNRNWGPYLPDAVGQMRDDGVRHALAVVTSAYASWSGCRQYRENLAAARHLVGEQAPEIDKVRTFSNHPGFIEAQTDRVRAALSRLPGDVRDEARLVFVAHAVPLAMARHSDYEAQLLDSCRLVVERLAPDRGWDLAWCSRSGPPQAPWTEPDVSDHLRWLAGRGGRSVAIVPIGFLSDHLEVLYDLDIEARTTAKELGLAFARAETVGTHPAFVDALVRLVAERVAGAPPLALGSRGVPHSVCPSDCCLVPGQPVAATVAGEAAPPV